MLIMVLWVLAVLTIMALSFTYVTRVEALSTFSFSRMVQMKYLAEAGVERGIAEFYYRLSHPVTGENEEDEETKAWNIDGTPHTVKVGTGGYDVGITIESGKVDINRTPEVILRSLLEMLGYEPEVVDTIADSIMDWKDADDFYRLQGAESDYYMSLPDPYEARNAKFETVEELMLVKGVTPEILYGEEGKKGLIDFLTVYSTTGKINLNAAPRQVLMAIPGMTPEIVDTLIQWREEGNTTNIQGLLGENYTIIAPYVELGVAGSTFTVETVGYLDPGGARYGIKAIVQAGGSSRFKYLYYKSPVDVKYDRRNQD